MNQPEFPSRQPRRLGFDTGVPNVARIYDALLGGKNNYAAGKQPES